MEGIIIKILSNDYTVLANKKEYICKARGKFRNLNITPLVGDYVVFDAKQNYILDIKKRKNYLIRPKVANVDLAIIVTSVKEPEFSSNLLDKLLVNIQFSNIKPVIYFSKMDLLKEKEEKAIEEIIKYYKTIGYEVYKSTEINKLKKIFKNKIVVFTGQSGSGKSSLINRLDSKLQMEIGNLSERLKRGKNTTRYTSLISILKGFVIDTPGFSSLDFNNMTKENIRDNFIEFSQFNCEYRDCMHIKEAGCKVKGSSKILESRYNNYLKFVEEVDK